MKIVREITAEEENFRLEEMKPETPSMSLPKMMVVRRDPIQPVPVGSYVICIFKVTGYDRDCDGSLMARLKQVDKDGETTGWEQDAIGIDSDCNILLDTPGELHDLMSKEK